MTASVPTTTRQGRAPRVARMASQGLRRSEQGMDVQVEMESLERANIREAHAIDSEIAVDLADDRRRFVKYQAVEKALRAPDLDVALAAFHSLVAHVEADEAREDEQRLGKRKARELHAARLRSLRTIFRDEVMPLLVGAQ